MAEGIGGFLSAAGVGSAIGQAVVQLELNTAKYNAELEAAQGKTVASTQAMGASTSKYAGFAKAAFLGIGVAAVAGVAVAIKAGSDLNEQINKAGEVFEGSAKKAIAFGKSAASSIGIASAEALEATSNFGQLLEAAGFAADAAEGMSEKMTTLGADLGSFNNIPVAEALEKIRAGLAGQARPLREVGVFLSEARVEAEAYSSGIAVVGEELTDAQKIQARYNIILDDTTKAQGDFQRTLGESLPNQLKVLQAELTNTAADLGIVLLPVVLDVVKAFKSIVPVLKFLADHLDLVVIALAGFAVFTYLPGLLFNIARGLEAMNAAAASQRVLQASFAVGELSTALAGIAVPAAAFAVAFAGITAAVAAWDPLQLVGDTEKLRDSMEVTTKTFGESEVILGRVAVSSNLVGDAFDDMGPSLDDSRAKAGLLSAGMLDLAGRTAESEAAVEDASKAVKNFAHMTDKELEEWSTDTKESFRTYVINLDKVQEETDFTRKDLRDSFRAMLEHARDLNQAMKTLSREHWINDDFVKFLAEQPDKLILFADSNEKQQKKMQEQWKVSGDILKNQVNDRLDTMTGVLDHLDKGETKHKVIIEYDYVGFDPTKPGMTGPQR